jgi:hypothetical protein
MFTSVDDVIAVVSYIGQGVNLAPEGRKANDSTNQAKKHFFLIDQSSGVPNRYGW